MPSNLSTQRQKSSTSNFRTDPARSRVASRLGEANINVNYAYCDLESGTNALHVYFGVAEVGRATAILEQAAAAAAKP